MRLKQAIDAGETDIVILADDAVARDNCIRMAETEAFTVETEDGGEEFIIRVAKNS